MRKWVEKLIEQFDFDWNEQKVPNPATTLSEDRATLLFIIDTYNKHLFEVAGHPVRKIRETLDDYAKEILNPKDGNIERVMFRFRQFFSTYRIDECAYFQKTFEDFRTIIWDFVDQLAEDMGAEQKDDQEIRQSLDKLKEAVESNSIEVLKNNSRLFIDCYMENQFKREKRKSSQIKAIRKNLSTVKKQLSDANDAMRTDHLTGALNRKSFDEYCDHHRKLAEIDGNPVSVVFIDIDYFKRINDTFGHDVGDFVLKELVNTIRPFLTGEGENIARVGGEEFAIVLPGATAEQAKIRAEEIRQKIGAETYIQDAHKIRFTVSMGVSQFHKGEDVPSWIKRADVALYQSKHNGRDRVTVAAAPVLKVA